MIHRVTLWAAIVFIIFCLPAVGLADRDAERKDSAAEVKQKALETYEALKRYSAEQREEAVAATREGLRELDERIAEIQQQLDEQWDDLSDETRREMRESLDALHRKREEVAEWLGGMRHSSAGAWEEVKTGFADSYERLRQAVEKAKEEFGE